MKSVQIRSFFWSVFSGIWTEYGETRCISPYSVWMRENTDQKNLHIWTLFSPCLVISWCIRKSKTNLGEKGVRCGFPNDFKEKKNVKVELIISIRNLFPHLYLVFSLAIIIMFTAQKWSFGLRISSVNVTKSARICGFRRIYRRNP